MTAPAGREVQVEYPPRFWWLKRLAWAGVGLVVLIVASRAWWGWEAERRLGRALAPAVARGEVVPPAALNPPELVNEANAAWYFKRAAKALNPGNPAPSEMDLDEPSGPPYGAAWNYLATTSVTSGAGAFPLARQARAFDRFDWGTRIARPMLSTLLRHLNDTRPVGFALADGAMVAHLRGDDVAALEAIRDVRHEAMGVRSDPFVVCHRVSVGIEQVAVERLLAIAPGLRIAPGDGPAPAAPAPGNAPGPFPTTRPLDQPRPVTRAHVRLLIGELLDEREDDASTRRAYAGERVMHLETADFLGGAAWWLRPMFRLDAARLMEADEDFQKAAAAPTWPAAQVFVDRAARRLDGSDPHDSLFPGMAGPNPGPRRPRDYTRGISASFADGRGGRGMEWTFRVRTERRMAAVSLAAQLYRADRGTWPATMEAMVPQYLPAVPADEMAADGGPLRYALFRGALPDGGDRPIVYSAGSNGTWDALTPARLLRVPNYGWLGTAEEWRDLARWARPSAPRPQPATNEAN